MADRCAIKEAQIIQGRLLDCKDEEILLGDKGIWDGANEARGSWQVEEGHSSPGAGGTTRDRGMEAEDVHRPRQSSSLQGLSRAAFIFK